MSTNSTSLEFTPEQKELRARYEALKREFSELFSLKNEMISHDLPFLTSLYLDLIGRKLYEVYCLSLELSILKQRMTLLQAYVNRNEAPDIEAVDKEIEVHFAEYQRRIEEEARRLTAARDYLLKGSFLSEDETKELRTIYFTIVKRLHPDINPNLTEEDKELFIKAQAAYEMLDLKTLRLILISLDLDNPPPIEAYKLEEMVEKLTENVRELQSQIDKLNLEFPFIFKEKLKNEEWVKYEIESAEREIDAYKIEIEKYKQYVILLEEWKPEFQN